MHIRKRFSQNVIFFSRESLVQKRSVKLLNDIRRILLGVLLLGGISAAHGATKQEYLDSLDQWVSHDMNDRWKGSTDKTLSAPNPPPDGKYFSYGRGEAMVALPMALVGASRVSKGDTAGGTILFQDALKIIRSCNKITVDGYDVNPPVLGGSTDQISFALLELVQTCKILEDQHVLVGLDLERSRTMLEKCADFRMRISPVPGLGGLANQDNRYAYGILLTANLLETQQQADASFAQQRPDLAAKLDHMRNWSAVVVRDALNYPYRYQLSSDGTPSPPMQEEKGGRLEPANITQPPRVAIPEDSSGYAETSIFYLLRLIAETPRRYIPELTDASLKNVCHWIDGYYQQMMPVGLMPPYGDAEWGIGAAGWIGVFESAAAQFKDKQQFGAAAPTFRDAAGRMFQYGQTAGKGFLSAELYEPITCMDDSIVPSAEPQKSYIMMQQTLDAQYVPSKVILRGNSPDPTQPIEQPYAMFNTFYSGSHSHMELGGLIAYCSGGSVFQHEAAYDAGQMFFHNVLIVRPAGEPFIPFANFFKDPKDSLLIKNSTPMPNDSRLMISAGLMDFKKFAYSKMVVDYTGSGELNRQHFLHSREAVLEKQSGVLMIFDTVTSKQNSGNISFGPLWHVQNILAQTQDGFLCQDDYQAVLEPKSKEPQVIGSKPRPVWIQMVGPQGTAMGDLQWHFYARHYHNDVPQVNNLYNRYEGEMKEGTPISLLTVFVPMPAGTKDASSEPNKPEVDGSNGTVRVGHFTYEFGPSSIATGSDGQQEADFQVSGKDEAGHSYSAAVLKGDNSKTDKKYESL